MTYDLSDNSIVVTGATSGIGLAVAEKMARAGAFVIGIGRSAERNAKAVGGIKSNVPDARVTYLLANLASQDQVRRVAGEIGNTLEGAGFAQLDVLVNNAGVYMARKVMTEDGIETTFAVNHLAGFLLTHELLSLLQRGHGRILTTSSYSHRTTPLCLGRVVSPWPHIGLMAYKRSKLSNVLFTYELNRRNLGVTAFAVDPGLVNTAIASKGSNGIEDLVWRRRRLKGTPAEVPARTYLYLAGEREVDVTRGYYFRDSAFMVPSQQSENEKLARKLWDLSCDLTGVAWD
jgi:NAD(P)-dependent dehydrogenase (short-subunit alcohol dehydrogenase family)